VNPDRQAGERGRPLVLSVSRRTDLPGFHAVECARRIRQRVARLRTRRLHAVVFWSRHPSAFVPGGALHDLVRRELANPHLNLTLTGLGRTAIEPGSPAVDEVLPSLPGLIEAFHCEPFRVRWRFDPLLPGYSSLEVFERIAREMGRLGVETCTFSFPAYRSLKGDLRPSFEAAGIAAWHEEDKRPFVASLADIASMHGLRLQSCNQPENRALDPRVEPAACISRFDLERGHPAGAVLAALGRDRSQRSHCNCVESEDLGSYETDRCLGGCAYCYSKSGGPLGNG
jgi:hypothetical protein